MLHATQAFFSEQKLFKERGTIKAYLETERQNTNFTNLPRNSHAPFSKPNNATKYIHAQSNHPPNTIKKIPIATNKRLSELSNNEEAFNNAKKPYQEALKNSGYEHELQYENPTQETNVNKSTRKNRTKNVLWYNPPFSKNMKTNLRKVFIRTAKRNFSSDHPLHKI